MVNKLYNDKEFVILLKFNVVCGRKRYKDMYKRKFFYYSYLYGFCFLLYLYVFINLFDLNKCLLCIVILLYYKKDIVILLLFEKYSSDLIF